MSSLAISMTEMAFSRSPPAVTAGVTKRIFGAPGLRTARNSQAASASDASSAG